MFLMPFMYLLTGSAFSISAFVIASILNMSHPKFWAIAGFVLGLLFLWLFTKFMPDYNEQKEEAQMEAMNILKERAKKGEISTTEHIIDDKGEVK
ncbi:putative membrane protein [Elusimicrobium posterum]|uniref:hypothetical protein n=1 Tax=Elusimicrobium posterum TaxID=3116653 RepID=UPI003C71E3CB